MLYAQVPDVGVLAIRTVCGDSDDAKCGVAVGVLTNGKWSPATVLRLAPPCGATAPKVVSNEYRSNRAWSVTRRM